MKLCWMKDKPPELERRLCVNDHAFNAQFKYAGNEIKTSKYTVFTFFPKNIFEQFRRLANFYFFILLILQVIPQISSLTWTTTAIPLVIVLAVTCLKDGIDDFQRHRSDYNVNNRKASLIRAGRVVEVPWNKVIVGDIIRITCDQFIAADLLLLTTNEPNGLAYIETAELDGETNLKVKQAIPDTFAMGEDLDKLSAFSADIICEAPNNQLNKFEGTMHWGEQKYSLDNDKILLRGCVLRNTEWVYGVVIFAGQDTKLMMNSGKTIFKRTNIDHMMNWIILGIFLYLLIMGVICMVAAGIWESFVGYNFQIYLFWESFIPGSQAPDSTYPEGSKEKGATTLALLIFLSYIIILNTVVPISLYVSVEMLRIGNSLWINWDEKMYYQASDVPAKARTTTLNEELGQIEFIFSDKTGTLTQNVMTFNKCSINGVSYGDVHDEEGNLLIFTESTSSVDLSWNKYSDGTFKFYDSSLVNDVRNHNSSVIDFFRVLALCHTVMPEEKDGLLVYQAQSPDEGALVSAAKNFGFVFKSRTPTTITIEVLGQEEVYELLCILDFNNVRKRMSVIVRKDGVITLMCKGADSVILDLLDSSGKLWDITNFHLSEFAQIGLRTLCIASKVIGSIEYEAWHKRYHEASCSQVNRDDKVSALYEEIERGLSLIGATAIEDKLQVGVPETISSLAIAGIKIWVLTGDKQETAINIGYSCNLLNDEMIKIYIVDGETEDEVYHQLSDAYHELHNIAHKLDDRDSTHSTIQQSDSFEFLEDFTQDCAVVINGHSLAHALSTKCEMLMLEVGCMCKAVICCRVTPLQKALVVDLVKKHKNSITLAIGDGANDVSMIKTAHIGVGISGQEGMQAVLSSDYSIAQFQFLERLLLVHGRWSYLRMCSFLKYFFYKNIAFTMCHFWFAFFCGFSAQALYDPYFISFYNLFYTSLPVLALGIFDQDVNDYYSIHYPKLYTPGHLNLFFNHRAFLWSMCEGIYASLALFFISYGAYNEAVNPWGHDLVDQQSFGVVIASILVVVINLRVAVDTLFWTGFNHFVIWGSIIFYFCFILVFYLPDLLYSYMGVAYQVWSTAAFWFTLILTNVIALLPIITYRFFMYRVRPSLTDRVRLRQRVHRLKFKTRLQRPHRQSTVRRSSRSLRSGYAFAHQEGFGQLITSGINMIRTLTPDHGNRGTVTPLTRKTEKKQPNENVASEESHISFLESSLDN